MDKMIGPKVRQWVEGFVVWCPACGFAHLFDKRWTFNGDGAAPTFHPSMLIRTELHGKPHVCHSFVESGRIRFLTDCTHALAGKTVPLPDWPL